MSESFWLKTEIVKKFGKGENWEAPPTNVLVEGDNDL